jgi:hypothetical protein
MSHVTVHVHMIVCQSLGETSYGPGRFDANRFYTRQQQIGGSKNSNDTACTFFDFLHGSRTTDIQPPIYRTGYDTDGIIPGSAATPFATIVASSIVSGSSEGSNIGVIADGNDVAMPEIEEVPAIEGAVGGA